MNNRSNEESRLDRGYRKLLEIDGNAGEEVKDSLNDFAPDLVRYMLEYSFGDIYSREGLDVRLKEIAVVAALTAIGNAMPQLKVHINAALNVGCTINDLKEVILTALGTAAPQLQFHIKAGLNVGLTIEEVKEIMLLMTVYVGFPAAINGMNILKEVARESFGTNA
jgi:alkylhydroperoxidase/carboxymuconolactone decarboxylase family protein YurZ